jgi:periplasmic protein CpxP/Spy
MAVAVTAAAAMVAGITNSTKTRGIVMTNFTENARRAFASSMAVCVIAIVSPALAAGSAQESRLSPSSACAVPSGHARSAAAALHIKQLHDQLKITPDQESQWNGVAQVMLDNATAMDGVMQERARKSASMNAVDDINSYQDIVAAHADGLKKLAAAFAPLYAAMPPAQQRTADAVFGHRTASRLRTHG